MRLVRQTVRLCSAVTFRLIRLLHLSVMLGLFGTVVAYLMLSTEAAWNRFELRQRAYDITVYDNNSEPLSVYGTNLEVLGTAVCFISLATKHYQCVKADHFAAIEAQVR